MPQTMSSSAHGSVAVQSLNPERERVFELFRRWGYLEASLDPLGLMRPQPQPELARFERAEAGYAAEARAIYCGSIGADFQHIPQPERRQWIAEQLEGAAPERDRNRVLNLLVWSDLFEQTLQQRYLGTKRFSLEGNTALIPLLDEILATAAEHGSETCLMGMSHRGRLNVLLNVMRRPLSEVIASFEDVDPRSVLGGGDVKYHMGATGEYDTHNGHTVEMHLVSNPSHLEAVDPVTIGRARAKQDRYGDHERRRVLPVLIHGDAAFAGQGIWAETLNMADVTAYTVGGTLQIIVNNLIGFTTSYAEEHSAPFASDIAKRQPVPIFHVNAEDLDAVLKVARIGAAYREKFRTDVVIDLIGYRRHGHSEVDDPTITQPKTYRIIKEHKALYEIYAAQYGLDAAPLVAAVRSAFDEAEKEAQAITKKPLMREMPHYWDAFCGGLHKPEYEVPTTMPAEELGQFAKRLTTVPDGFRVHPKIKKLLEQRAEMGTGKRALDYGMAEALAFASLVAYGTPVRLSGQDCRRGTFNQRHSVLVDNETEDTYMPLAHVAPGQASCQIFNSTLSEQGVLGFEYGYSRDYPETLVLWEAQFGDFANVAQAVIDQFISAGEEKWGLLSGITLLLPHGYEGQGPEHSSARIERYLQLAARDNMQICQPSSAAQYFHLLRRQALRKWRKPLIVFTPKSMLRSPEASSPLSDLTSGRFHNVVPDAEVTGARRVLLCSGKIGHELKVERRRRKDKQTAILFVDQLYPFPQAELEAELAKHPDAHELVWVQEEPANMGPLFYMLPRLRHLAGERQVLSVKRSASPSPATGSAKAHEMEQKTLLNFAFTTGKGTAVHPSDETRH